MIILNYSQLKKKKKFNYFEIKFEILLWKDKNENYLRIIFVEKKKMKMLFSICILITCCNCLRWRLANDMDWKDLQSYPYIGNIDKSFRIENLIKPIFNLSQLDICSGSNSSINVNQNKITFSLKKKIIKIEIISSKINLQS